MAVVWMAVIPMAVVWMAIVVHPLKYFQFLGGAVAARPLGI